LKLVTTFTCLKLKSVVHPGGIRVTC